MPKRKRLPELHEFPDISGIGRHDKDPHNWLIQKSKPLMTLSNTSMTLSELKILDAYLGRIDSSQSDNRYVRLERGELEKLLGVSKINKSDLEKRLRNLFQVLEIRDERKPKGFTLISLFTKAECIQDDNGLWQVDLACSPEALEYMFNTENIGYLKYRLRNVINLTSRYSYILFLYLLDNRYRKSFIVSLTELKALLKCTAESYLEFKLFNDRILKKCHKEINEKTNLSYSYEPIKKGRKISDIRFIIETLSESFNESKYDSELFQESVQLPLFDNSNIDDELLYYSKALDNSCNKSDLEQLLAMLDILHPEYDSGQKYGYLSYLWSKVQHYDNKKSINDKAAYIKSMLENEIKTSKKTEKSQNDDSSNVDKYKQLINKF